MAVYNEQFSNGIPFMAASAKRFISELNKLANAMKSGEGRQYVMFTLHYLKDYCETYLALENRIMLKHCFYDESNHTALHAGFKEDVQNLIRRYEECGSEHSIPLAVQQLMAGWLMRHIGKQDKVLSDYLMSMLKKKQT
ncbi:hemerythrin-like metal-binding protein [Denitrovibrio acetiphilus DSM 12809]|uniref:Hemerythrin-like metal-binding protein n=1 Tax=Denitrovibrio acetiphilus (strain DSM 12809 / NBRC 114555 / N2460) TaxID=522772 RepID=D4H2L8_DENA2|nr:hemerythrin family protein [Denitrovibrio acetiphilus]ADD67079.1 hemerythrin-like metal-binding protein [Denitrovibrio acetiphilus DSM 12809]